jgi:Na+-transporting NADH:ubiquinone oxidoreductase subunit NqrE
MLHFVFTLCYILDIHKHKCKDKMVGIFLHIIFINCFGEAEFGVQARWNYLESGHGKGPCGGWPRGQREEICRQCHQPRQSQHTDRT